MNFFNKNSEIIINELNHQLSEFGLQPKEWALIKDSHQQIKTQNKDCNSFYFIGSTKILNGKRQWKNIQLASL